MDWNEVIHWNAVYDILVATCGAPEAYRDSFLADEGNFKEFRFQGALGFGGKIWRGHEGLSVTCYPEDMTEERRAIIEEANRQLSVLSAARHREG